MVVRQRRPPLSPFSLGSAQRLMGFQPPSFLLFLGGVYLIGEMFFLSGDLNFGTAWHYVEAAWLPSAELGWPPTCTW